MQEPASSDNAVPGKGKVVIAGGTGFLGRNLAGFLVREGYEVVVLARHPREDAPGLRQARWDARTVGDWARHLEGVDAIVNLAGRSVDCRKTPDHCDEIVRSRVEPTEVLGRALRQVQAAPRVWVQMSTAHRYGDPPEVVCDEDSAFGHGLGPFVAQAWEEAFARAVPPGVRQVVLRTSFVLGRSGGALRRLVGIARFGLGGKVGHGRQGMSWIHEDDMSKVLLRAIADGSMSGAYMVTAPHPVSNAEFMRELRRALRVPIGLPAMAWMVRIGAPLLGADPNLALYGRYCVPKRLLEEGFTFRFSEVGPALQDLFARKGKPDGGQS